MTILPYTGLVLINNDALMLPLHYMYVVMVSAFGVLLTSSILLVLLNYKIYLPLRKFTSQFSDSRENEISIIENKIHDLLTEINTLSQHSKEQIPEKIALHYLLCGGSQLDAETLQILDQKYPYYMVMALAIQKDSGIEDLPFASSLEKTLTSQFSLRFISLDKFSFAVLARPRKRRKSSPFSRRLPRKLQKPPGFSLVSGNTVQISGSFRRNTSWQKTASSPPRFFLWKISPSRKMQRFFRENGWARRCRTVSLNMPETVLWTSFCRS